MLEANSFNINRRLVCLHMRYEGNDAVLAMCGERI